MGGTCRIRVSICRTLLASVSTSVGEAEWSAPATAPAPSNGTEAEAAAAAYEDKGTRGGGAGGECLVACFGSWSSDTTVRELAQAPLAMQLGAESEVNILDLLERRGARLWDGTLHPPRDVTDWPLRRFPEKQGLRSRTLYDAGWYPSGALFVLPPGTPPGDVGEATWQRYDDPQYNRPDLAGEWSISPSQRDGGGRTTTVSRAPPSEVLRSVTERWGAPANRHDESAGTKELRRQQRQRCRIADQRRRDRWDALDARIRRLQEGGEGAKNRAVSQQVERMLIRSRATGRPGLPARDRFHLTFVLDRGGGDDEIGLEHRYVSPQDTVGRILAAFPGPEGMTTEALVRRRGDSEYQRLPTLSRVYELVSQGVVSEFDRIVVRWYDPTREAATASTLLQGDEEPELALTADNEGTVGDSGETAPASAEETPPPVDSPAPTGESVSDRTAIEPTSSSAALAPDVTALVASADTHPNTKQILLALQSYDNSANRKPKAAQSKSASSAAVEKVRRMQLKGKAQGDAKRVAPHNRFYLDLATVVAVAPAPLECAVQSCGPIFMSQSDTLGRLIRDYVRCPSPSDDWTVTLLASSSGSHQLRVVAEHGLTLQEAERQNLVCSFDRLIAYVARRR